MTQLPRAVQEQLERAEAIQAEMNVAPAGQADTPQEPQQQVATPPEVVEPVSQAPAPQPAPQPSVDFETKYRVLQGKYNAEVPHLTQQVQALSQALQEMQAQVAEAQKQRTKVDADSLVTDADKEAFGADLVNLVERAARKNVLPVQAELERLTQENAALRQQLERTEVDVQTTSKQGFFDGLTRAVPQWEQLNEDPGFLGWLEQMDPVFGVQRQEALDRAAASLNVKAAAAVFNAYLAATAAPEKPAKTARDDLQSQVAPSRSRAGVAPEVDPAATKIWTNQEIAAFYTGIRQGAYTDEQAARIQSDIDRAAAEGRVR